MKIKQILKLKNLENPKIKINQKKSKIVVIVKNQNV